MRLTFRLILTDSYSSWRRAIDDIMTMMQNVLCAYRILIPNGTDITPDSPKYIYLTYQSIGSRLTSLQPSWAMSNCENKGKSTWIPPIEFRVQCIECVTTAFTSCGCRKQDKRVKLCGRDFRGGFNPQVGHELTLMTMKMQIHNMQGMDYMEMVHSPAT